MMIFGGWNLNAPLAVRAVHSLAIASVYNVLLFSLSESMASRVLRGILIPKHSLTGVFIFIFKATFPFDLFGVTENFRRVNPQ